MFSKNQQSNKLPVKEWRRQTARVKDSMGREECVCAHDKYAHYSHGCIRTRWEEHVHSIWIPQHNDGHKQCKFSQLAQMPLNVMSLWHHKHISHLIQHVRNWSALIPALLETEVYGVEFSRNGIYCVVYGTYCQEFSINKFWNYSSK